MCLGAARLLMEDCLEREETGLSTCGDWSDDSSSTMLGSLEVVEVVEGRARGDVCD